MNILDLTPEQFFAAAKTCLDNVSDESPTQMHRRAIVGKSLVVHKHAWDSSALNGDGGIALSIHVAGQFIDRARNTFSIRTERDAYAAELEQLIGGYTVPQ